MFTPVPYVTTLKQVMDSGSTEGYFPFMRFAKLKPTGEIDTWDCVPWGRFREIPNRTDVVQVRSCDCWGSECGTPTVTHNIPVDLLDKYFFIDGNMIVMTFAYKPH